MMGIANGILLDGRQNSIDQSAMPIVTFLPPRRRTSEWDSNRKGLRRLFRACPSERVVVGFASKSCGGTDAYSAAWRQFAS
jgi:hypothetical protein